MAKSNAQRQAEYRARHLHDLGATGERLNVVIDFHAKLALERLAACYGVTQRGMLERIIQDADRYALDDASRFPNGQNDFYDKKLTLK